MILILLVGGLLAGGFMVRLQSFCRDLKHVTSEIHRTEGAEQEHWRRCRRQLWTDLLLWRG